MNALISQITTAARKRAAYHRTLFELKSLSLDVALDLDINVSDAKGIAYRSVYGQ